MKLLKYILCIYVLIFIVSCSEEVEPMLKNDYIMKTVAPAVAGETLEFAYAMGALDGKLKTAKAEVSIPGALGTGFDTKSYHADSRGNDVGVLVVDTLTESSLSTAVFIIDTTAATLRFNYVLPQEAKGKNVLVKFTVESTKGEITSVSTPQLKVSMMDLKRELLMSNNNVCYFSLETMEAYTESEVIENGLTDKIDLVYLYDALNPDGIAYGHALVSPATDSKYLNGRTIPESFKKNKTKIEKYVYLKDMQLSGEVPATFVDDIDFETMNLSHALDYVLGIKSKNSVFVETEDGKYRAYLYFNKARSRKLTFGIKRYQVK